MMMMQSLAARSRGRLFQRCRLSHYKDRITRKHPLPLGGSSDKPIDELLRNIDTSLTDQQRVHVEALKKSYKGAKAERCKLPNLELRFPHSKMYISCL